MSPWGTSKLIPSIESLGADLMTCSIIIIIQKIMLDVDRLSRMAPRQRLNLTIYFPLILKSSLCFLLRTKTHAPLLTGYTVIFFEKRSTDPRNVLVFVVRDRPFNLKRGV